MGAQDYAATDDWPEPVEFINGGASSEIVLVCDHASNHIPREYGSLGVAPSDLQRHIAWDVGAAEVTRGLAHALGAPAFLGTYSRMLVDLNRPFGAPTSIPVLSEATPIPGNLNLPESERARRKAEVFDPFHAGVSDFLDKRVHFGMLTRIVAIHSFTPVFLGVPRPWHVGILYDKATAFAERALSVLREDKTLLVGANVPYVIDRDEDYAVPVHGDDRGNPAILVEVRNDLISSHAGIQEWIGRLAGMLAASS